MKKSQSSRRKRLPSKKATDTRKYPTIFIGSSSEALSNAKVVDDGLRDVADVQIWTTAFNPGDWVLATILKRAEQSDFGLFVLAPDDEGTSRGQSYKFVRDNVIFEVGVFMGTLGPERTFVLAPQGAKSWLRLPSDLEGLTYLEYTHSANRKHDNLAAAVSIVRGRINSLGAALRSGYSEMRSLEQTLIERELLFAGRSTESVSLMELIRRAALQRKAPWYRNTPVGVLLHAIDEEYEDHIVDDAFWWLVVYGVITFKDIDLWNEGKKWRWKNSIGNAIFTERGLVLLNGLRGVAPTPD